MPWAMERGFVPSDHDKKRVGEILRGEGDWYSAHLFRLIAKADRANYAILKGAYPEHVAAYEAWREGIAAPPLFPSDDLYECGDACCNMAVCICGDCPDCSGGIE